MLKLHRESPLLTYWRSRYDFVRFDILFRLFEAFIFTPLAALAGNFLSGRPVVDSTDLVGFVLSPRGFLATFVGATAARDDPPGRTGRIVGDCAGGRSAVTA